MLVCIYHYLTEVLDTNNNNTKGTRVLLFIKYSSATSTVEGRTKFSIDSTSLTVVGMVVGHGEGTRFEDY